MNTRLGLTISVLAFTLFWQTSPTFAEPASTQPANAPAAEKPVLLQGGVESFGILTDATQSKLGIACGKDIKGRIEIDQIRPGTEAYYKGLEKGDLVLDARVDGNQIAITINRKGFTYTAHLDVDRHSPFRLQREAAIVDLGHQSFPIKATVQAPFSLKAQRIQTLSNYDLEFLIDRSLSMRRPDCPGGLSRWDWCAFQATDIAKALAPYTRGGLTITRFATEFDTHEHASPRNIVDVLGRHDFQLGTCLFEPLQARLDNYFANHVPGGKPLLIAVITDGLPWPRPEPRMVREELVSASQRMAEPGEVTVVFLQIGGDDMKGRNYLVDLGENLVDYGARYQYVHTIPFEQLEEVGLERALVETVQHYSPPSQTAHTAASMKVR